MRPTPEAPGLTPAQTPGGRPSSGRSPRVPAAIRRAASARPSRAPFRPAPRRVRGRHIAAAAGPIAVRPATRPVRGCSRSCRAISKPSVFSKITLRRSRAVVRQGLLEQQHAHAVGGTAADAAAQLVQLRQAEALGVLDDHERRIGHVDAHLDHGRRDQHVRSADDERRHRRGLLSGFIRPCSRPTAQSRQRAAASCACVRAHSAGPAVCSSSFSPRSAGTPSRSAGLRPACRTHGVDDLARRFWH
jgi:hypothetical protein